MCDLETVKVRRPCPALGRSATGRKKLNFRDNSWSSWSWCLGFVEVQVRTLFGLVYSCVYLFTYLYGSLPQSTHTNITKVVIERFVFFTLSSLRSYLKRLTNCGWKLMEGGWSERYSELGPVTDERRWCRCTGTFWSAGTGGPAYRTGLRAAGVVIGLWTLVGVLQGVHVVCFTRTELLIICSLKMKLSLWKPWRHVGEWRYSSSYS